MLLDKSWITAAACARDWPEDLARRLESFRYQEYQRLRIVMVDNAPSDWRSRCLL
ncbi:MAG: hypothetical protein ACLP01_08870 [Solirubrobacteraceae bacterium]